MSNTVMRREFVRELGENGGALNVNDLSPEARKTLGDAGVSMAELQKLAGPDGQIGGEREMNALFAELDGIDRDGSSQSFLASTGQGQDKRTTLAGAAFQALREEVDENRRQAQSQGIVHLGMRPASEREVRRLEAVTQPGSGGVHALRGYQAEGRVELGGRDFDLASGTGLVAFREALIVGPTFMPPDRADAFLAVLRGADPRTRDELAQLGLALQRMGTGELAANRLVLSGHSSGSGITGDGGGYIHHETVRELGRVFPEGAARIEHLALSACYSAKSAELDKFRADFPALKSFWGYEGTSPKAESGAPDHLARWARRTDGDDPSQVDPGGRNVATWNVADGEQRFPSLSRWEAEAALSASEGRWHEYESGARTLERGGVDPELDRYYQNLQRALSLRDLPPERRAELEVIRDRVLQVRHPELGD